MGKVEAVIMFMLGLIALGLVLKNPQGVTPTVSAIAKGGSDIFKTLQYR